MTQLINPTDIHTAAATWSGFIYQGKVALYHVLHLLNTDSNFLDYSLQLDSLEDFAITKLVGGEITPVTLHQVKAMKSSLYSSYKVAFEKLEKRLIDFHCNGAYFHLAINNEKTIDEIKRLHPTIDIYNQYNDDGYCSLDEIDIKCKNQISLFLDDNALAHRNTPENLEVLKNNIEALISSQIIAIHSNNHKRGGLSIREGAYYFTIPLSNFIEILREDPQDLLDEKYYIFLTKKLLNQYHYEFCLETQDDIEDEGKVITTEQKEKLNQYLQQINALEETSLLKFITSLLPNRKVKLNNIIDFKDGNVNKDEFKGAFLKILFQLIKPIGEIGKNLTWIDANNLKYTATAINQGTSSAKDVCKSIYKNIQDTDIEIPYESDKLITSDIDVESIKEKLNIQSEVDKDKSDKNNITKWYDIGLVSLRIAKTIIK